MSALDRLFEQIQKTLSARKPGIIDTENHKQMRDYLDKLEKYEQMYKSALDRVRCGISMVNAAREDDIAALSALTQPKKTLAERLKDDMAKTDGSALTSTIAPAPTPTLALAPAPTSTPALARAPTYSAVVNGTPLLKLNPVQTGANAPALATALAPALAPALAAAKDPPAAVFMQTTASRNRELATTQNGLHSRPQRIRISPSIEIDAITVANSDGVRQDGYLYYISAWDHFAFRINGFLFHGNVGVIYEKPSESSRTADCRYDNCRHRATCMYYHDPARYPGSNERRNYYNAALTYSPGDAPRKKNMHFGSLTNLESDITHIDVASANMMRDHTMHDLLCAMIAIDRAQKNEHPMA